MPEDATIPRLPIRRPPPKEQTMPDFSKPDSPANVVPLKKPQPRKMSLSKLVNKVTPKVNVPRTPKMPAQQLDFPVHRTRRPQAVPVTGGAEDNVRVMLNTHWLDAFMRKVRLHINTPQLMIEQEKRLLLVDYSNA